MNRMLFLALFMVCGCCRGETNSISCELFRAPAAELRPLSIETHETVTPAKAESLTLDVPRPTQSHFDIGRSLDQSSFAAGAGPTGYSGSLDPALYRYLDKSGYLTRPAPPSSNLLVRATDAVFTPETVHLGKTTTFSCSILTAIKRKNPLCLLNTLPFLQLSW